MGLLLLTSLVIQGTVVVDICVAQGPASHSITADADGRHRADLDRHNETSDNALCMCGVAGSCTGAAGAVGEDEGERRLLLQGLMLTWENNSYRDASVASRSRSPTYREEFWGGAVLAGAAASVAAIFTQRPGTCWQ
jgi:hypothetical protein